MKKKFLLILLTIVSAVCLAFGIAACGGSGEGHTHSFTWVYNNDATCTEAGTETGTCACGETQTRTKTSSALGHDFQPLPAKEATCSENGYSAHNGCTRCGYTTDNVTYTDALHVQYELNDAGDRYTVVNLNKDCTDTAIEIPHYYMGLPVTAISNLAFSDCTLLTSIVIPKGVTEIGDSAFSGCVSLEKILLPDGIKEIGADAFTMHTAFYETASNWINDMLYIGKYLIYAKKDIAGECVIKPGTILIADSAFLGCNKMASVTIPEDVTSIGDTAFSGCNSLTSVTFEGKSQLTTIGYDGFSYCESLTNITIPKGVTSIGVRAFDGCKTLEIEVDSRNEKYHATNNCLIDMENKILIWGCTTSVIPNDGSVTSIGEYAFDYCYSLSNIVIPEGVTSIGEYAFCNCLSLSGIVIPDSLREIGYSAFSGCRSLTSIVIPESVTSIGYDAFRWCYKLVEVWNYSHLPIEKSKESYGNVAYYAKHVYSAHEPSKQMVTSDGYIFYEDENEIYLLGHEGNETALTLPALSPSRKPYAIYQYACCAFSWLKNIVIPKGVISIEERAFTGCDALESVTFEGKSQLTSIGDEAFYGCSSLKSIIIPESVTSIGNNAFEYCSSLTKVYYCGTKADWGNIDIENSFGDNNDFLGAKRYYFSEEAPTAEEWAECEYWWHYDGTGKVVEWVKPEG